MKYKKSDYDFLIDNNSLYNDLQSEKFDIDWQKNFDEPIKTCTILPQEKHHIEDDKTVVYNFNNELFRSDDFTNVHDGQHILFSGCSETEGAGANIEHAWSKILYDKISQKIKCSGFFNLAKSGWGYSRIISNCLTYFKKYGNPDIIFILLPNSGRNFRYNMEKNIWAYASQVPETYYSKESPLSDGIEKIYPNGEPTTMQKNFYDRSTPKEYKEEFVRFLYNWKIFIELCNEKNIKIIFSTWDLQDSINLKNINIFDDYLHIEKKQILSFGSIYYQTNQPSNTDIKKRDGHHGLIAHNAWAEFFYQAYINE